MRLIALFLLVGCSSAASVPPQTFCYGTRDGTAYACSGARDAIQARDGGVSVCSCPQYTACLLFALDGEPTTACVLLAGD